MGAAKRLRAHVAAGGEDWGLHGYRSPGRRVTEATWKYGKQGWEWFVFLSVVAALHSLKSERKDAASGS